MRAKVAIWTMLVVVTGISAAAHADPLFEFNFVGNGHTYDFQLPDFPPVQQHQKTNTFGAETTGTVDGVSSLVDVSFTVINVSYIQDITVSVPGRSDLALGLFGPEPYTLTSTPIPPDQCNYASGTYCIELSTKFNPGVYQYTNCCGTTVFPVTLTVTEVGGGTVTPEPGTLWLLGTGALGSLAGLRRQSTRRRAAPPLPAASRSVPN